MYKNGRSIGKTKSNQEWDKIDDEGDKFIVFSIMWVMMHSKE